jgi:antitoxin component YwqK of YwqJK toxin-antitoxin module
MKLLLSFLFLFYFAPNFYSQETTTIDGEKYFVYPTNCNHPRKVRQKYSYLNTYEIWQRILPTEILPNFKTLKNGEYVIFYKSKRKNEIACFFNLKNNVPEGKAIWFYPNKDTLAIQHYQKGVKHGIEQKYGDKGYLLLKTSFKNGVMDGPFKEFYWNTNQLFKTEEYINNFKQHNSKTYEENGDLKSIEFEQDTMFVTYSYKNKQVRSKTYNGFSSSWNSKVYYFDGVLTDSIYPSDQDYYYPSKIGSVYLSNLFSNLPQGTHFLNTEGAHRLYYPNGQKKTDLHFGSPNDLTMKEFGKYHYSSYGFYFDTIFHQDGTVKYILEEKSTLKNVTTFNFKDTYGYKKNSKSYNLTFHDGSLSSYEVVCRNKNGRIDSTYYLFAKEYIDTAITDSMLIYEKKTSKSYYRRYWFKDSVSQYFESFNYYKNGQPKEIIKGWTTFNPSYKLRKASYHKIYTKEGLELARDSANRISIGGEYLNGFYKFNYAKLGQRISDIESLDESFEYSLANLNFTAPYQHNLMGKYYRSTLYSPNIGYPTSGYFKNGYQDSIWTFKHRKSKCTIKYKQGKMNGLSESKFKTGNRLYNQKLLEYIKYDKEDIKKKSKQLKLKVNTEKRIYINDSLREKNSFYSNGEVYEHQTHFQNTEICYTLTPWGDTISTSNKYDDISLFKKSNKSDPVKEISCIGDSIFTKIYCNGFLTTEHTQYKGKYLGKLIERDCNNNILIIQNYDSSLTIQSKSFRSLENKYVLIDKKIPYSEQYENNKINFSGYSLSEDFSQDFYLKNTLYYTNEMPHFMFFIDTAGASIKWIKEYYPSGQLKADGQQFLTYIQEDCDKNYQLKFDYCPKNYWDRNGIQTLKDGTGYLFYKEEGTPKYEGELNNSHREGIWKFYDGNGNLTEFGKYVNNQKDGIWYSGDLKHIHFLEECLDSSHPKYEKVKKELENQVSIIVTIYRNGTPLTSTQHEN